MQKDDRQTLIGLKAAQKAQRVADDLANPDRADFYERRRFAELRRAYPAQPLPRPEPEQEQPATSPAPAPKTSQVDKDFGERLIVILTIVLIIYSFILWKQQQAEKPRPPMKIQTTGSQR